MKKNNDSKKAVLFDLDGTLLDTMPDFLTAAKKLLKQENKTFSISTEKFKSSISMGSKEIVKTIFNINEDNRNFKNLLDRFLKLYQETNHKNTKPFSGIIELLETLNKSQIKWGIVTNKPTLFTMQIINVKNFLQKSSVIICGDTTPYSKPHPMPLNHACKKINIAPQNCIFIGDSKNDILAGNTAKMTTITALFGYIPSIKEAKLWPCNYQAENVAKLSLLLNTLIK